MRDGVCTAAYARAAFVRVAKSTIRGKPVVLSLVGAPLGRDAFFALERDDCKSVAPEERSYKSGLMPQMVTLNNATTPSPR
jgi:hypothetical protein